MTPQERDTLVLAYLDGKVDERELGRLDEMLRGDRNLASRLAELSLNDAMIADEAESVRVPGSPRTSFQPDGSLASHSSPVKGVLVAAAAAAAVIAALAWIVGQGGESREKRPDVEARRQDPKREIPPVAPAPTPAPRSGPGGPSAVPDAAPPPPPKVPVPAPVTASAPKGEPGKAELPQDPAPSVPIPQPSQPPDESPTSKVAKVKPAPRPILLTSVRGGLSRVRAGHSGAMTGRAEVEGEDVLSTAQRQAASFQLDDGATFWLNRSTSIGMGRDEEGALRVRLVTGAVLLKTTGPATVTAPAGDLRCPGGAFQADLDKGRLQVLVLDGTVQLIGSKGEQAVRAGQRCAIRPGEKPSPPLKVETDAATAWAKAPVLAAELPEGPYLERESGGNRKFSGLVFTAPFSDGEEQSGRMARAVAETADAGLVLGHGYRDAGRRLWINVDRGMEGDVAADGSVANERFTERARRSTAEFLDECRAASGAAPREPVPVVFQFRTHYLKQGDVAVDVAELAWAGWNRATMAQAKAVYAQLLDKHKPASRLEIKVQGVDEAYDWRGTRRKFSLSDDDARQEGVLSPRNARNAVVLFLPQGFGRVLADLDLYARIFSELAEFLSGRRR